MYHLYCKEGLYTQHDTVNTVSCIVLILNVKFVLCKQKQTKAVTKVVITLTYLFEDLVPVVLITARVVLEFLLILYCHCGNRNYASRKIEEIVKDCVTENTWKEMTTKHMEQGFIIRVCVMNYQR